MGSLTSIIAATSQAKYGVNILEKKPPGSISGDASNVVGCVADLPWGPVNTPTFISSTGALFETFCPAEFEAENDYAALKAFLNKKFPAGVWVCRIAATSQATSSQDYDDEDATESVTVTANYPGLLGDSVSIEWAANADTATNRDAIVTIGSTYSVRYENVITAALTLTDPGDPFVTFSKHANCVKVPDVAAAAALTGGADGTAVAGDYVGSGVSTVGIRKFYGESMDIDVLFVAECPSGLIDDVNTGLEAYAVDTDKGMAVLCTVASQTPTAAITYAADYRDDRLVYPWPKVKTTNGYDSANGEITVDGNAFVVAAIANVEPELSPGGAGGKDYLTGITGLENEDATVTDYENMNDAGIAPFFMSSALGPIIRRGVTTSLTSGLTKIFRRRMTDYIVKSIAARMEYFVETKLDLDLANEALGDNTGAQVGEIQTFLGNLENQKRIKDFQVDPFSANTKTNIDAGQWNIGIAVELYSMQEAIVLIANVGEGVTIAEAA